MKKLHSLIIILLISSLICTFAISQVSACEWIVVTQTPNGLITPDTLGVEIGDTPIFSITPNIGYHIASITVNSKPVAVTSSSGQSYQFSPITLSGGTITATFEVNIPIPAPTASPTPYVTPTPHTNSPTVPAPTGNPITPTPVSAPLGFSPSITPSPTPTITPSSYSFLLILIAIISAFIATILVYKKKSKKIQ
jgi:hypothetical protein